MPRHFVLSRLGLGIFSDSWFEQMISLFETITLPSLASQTSKDFVWLIVVDRGMPAPARERLERLIQPHAHFHLVTIDITQMTWMRLGGHDWIYEPCKEYILGAGLIEDPTEYITTSIIDCDDAWHVDMVRRVNSFAESRVSGLTQEEPRRGSHVRHSSGMVLTYVQGLVFFASTTAIGPSRTPFLSMSVSVLARFSSGISALSSRHAKWAEAAAVADFEPVQIENSEPMWLYVRHDRTALPWQSPASLRAATQAQMQELGRVFGIDLNRLDEWRSKYALDLKKKPKVTDYPGHSPRVQYSRIFHLTALNRQIEALRRGQMLPASKHLQELLATQEQRREELIRQIVREGTDRY